MSIKGLENLESRDLLNVVLDLIFEEYKGLNVEISLADDYTVIIQCQEESIYDEYIILSEEEIRDIMDIYVNDWYEECVRKEVDADVLLYINEHEWKTDHRPDDIRDCFPTLNLERIDITNPYKWGWEIYLIEDVD